MKFFFVIFDLFVQNKFVDDHNQIYSFHRNSYWSNKKKPYKDLENVQRNEMFVKDEYQFREKHLSDRSQSTINKYKWEERSNFLSRSAMDSHAAVEI